MELFVFGAIFIFANVAPVYEGIPLPAPKEMSDDVPGEFGEYFEGDMVLSPSQRRAISVAMEARNGLRGGAKRWPERTIIYHIQEDDFDLTGKYFEGDMVLSPSQRRTISVVMEARKGLRGGAKSWPECTIIYHIQEDDFDEDQVKLIEEGMADIASKSCLKFRRREKDNEHAVVIQGSANGCFSNVGFSNEDDDDDANQVLNLAKGCFKHGTVVHEMLHTIGFYHMQSTYDRDDFVKIIWENIRAGTEHNFAKYTNDTVTDFGVPYDYDSVMHYPEAAFSKNGNKTIIPLKENVKIGQRDGLSESDVLKLNKMYCEESDEVKITHRLK